MLGSAVTARRLRPRDSDRAPSYGRSKLILGVSSDVTLFI